MKKFEIYSDNEVFVDIYDEGEKEQVNSYFLSQKIEAENYKEAIKKYFSNHLYYEYEDKEENYDKEQNCIFYSVLVDIQNCEASKNEIESWKAGNLGLYSNNIFLKISEIIEVKF